MKVLTTGLRRDTRSVEVSLGPVGAGWHALEIASGTTKFPGWWRRFGTFVLTIAGEQSLDPPTNLDARTPDSGSLDSGPLDSGPLDSGPLDPRTPGAGTLLEDAEPTHTWLRNPLTGLAN